MRMRNNPNAKIELSNSSYLIKKFPYKVPINTVIELGMGKGEMITKLALLNLNQHYLGIERYATAAHKAMKKAEKNKLNNFHIICEDIKNLNNLIVGKAKTIWLTFSDPWPKKRHIKRRLTHINFINLYKNILSKDGIIKMKTDNDKFFKWTLKHLKENNIKTQNVTKNFHISDYSKVNIMTDYEKKWSLTNKKINYLEIKF